MERKVAVVYTVFSILAFIALTTWLALSLNQTKANNLIAAANTFVDVKNSISVAIRNQGNLNTPSVQQYVRSLFLQDPEVDLVSITSPQGQVLYLFARHTSYLVPPLVRGDSFVGSVRYSNLTQRLFTAELPPITAQKRPDKISAVFTTVSRDDLYSLARVVLICLITFVILTGIMILVVPLLDRQRRSPPRRGAAAPERSESTAAGAKAHRGATTDALHRPGGDSEGPVGANHSRTASTPSEPPVNELPTGTKPIVLSGGPSDEGGATSLQFEVLEDTPRPETFEALPREQTGSDTETGASATGQPTIEGTDISPKTEHPYHRPEYVEPPSLSVVGTENELPPQVELPSLHEVLGEDTENPDEPAELSLYTGIDEPAEQSPAAAPSAEPYDATESLELVEETKESLPAEETSQAIRPATPDDTELLEVTEIEDHGAREYSDSSEPSSYRSGADELEDIDFEDLEALDGHASAEPPEPVARRPSSPPPPAAPPAPEPESDVLAEEPILIEEPVLIEEPSIEEPQELLEIPEDFPPPTDTPAPVEPENEPPIDLSLEEEDLALAPIEEGPTPIELELYEKEQAPLELIIDEEPLLEVEELQEIETEARVDAIEEEPAPVPDSLEDSPILILDSTMTDEEPPPPAEPALAHTAARDLFNPESGLAWQDHLEQRLSFELDRAASFDQDLSLALIRFVEPAESVSRLNYARDIRAYFPFRDLAFEYGDDSFAIVLPNTDIDQAIRSMENFNSKQLEDRPEAPRVFIGLSARNGRLLGGERLLTEAETAAAKAREDRQNVIFALRVDPGKYREYIKSTLK